MDLADSCREPSGIIDSCSRAGIIFRSCCSFFALLLLCFAGPTTFGQAYLLRYTTTASGAVTFTGNTLGLAKVSNRNNPGQLDSIGGFITLNTNSQLGTYPLGTTLNWSNNSSAAVLRMPTNSTVLYAELIWAGAAQITTDTTPTGDVLPYLDRSVRFILPNGVTNLIAPDPVTASVVTNGTAANPAALFYVRSADVTTLVQAGGAGTYSVGGVPACVLAGENANNAAGWTLAVIYGNSALHQRNLSLFVGNSFAATTAPTPAPVGVVGFCAPPTGAVNGYLFVSAIEGDPSKTGDQMLFGPTTNTLAVLSGPNNRSTNFFAGQINYCQPDSTNNGTLDTSGTFGLSNSVPPNVGFSARQGWDITCVNVSAGLTNGIQSAYAQNVTQGDGYSVNALALQIDVGAPDLSSAQSVDKASTFVGDTLTYSVVITNSGIADAQNVVFTDPLPSGTSFIPDTFTTNGVVVSGANPVNGVPLPTLATGSKLTCTYQVQVNQIPPSAKFTSGASISYQYVGACDQSPIISSTLLGQNAEILAALLVVSKSADLTNVIPGATFTYTITVLNSGTTNSVGSTLLDQLPQGVTYVLNTTTLNGVPVPDLNGTDMPFTLAQEIHGPGRPAGQINPGDTAVVTFKVTISTNPPSRISNLATVLANGGAPSSGATGGNSISPVYSDLAVGIVGSPNPVIAGAPVTFTLSVTNTGPSAVNTITNFISLYLALPPSILSPVYTPSAGNYDPLSGIWSGLTLASNDVVTLTISAQVTPAPNSSSLSASVVLTPPPGITDGVTNNNSATLILPVVQVADLTVTIDDGVTSVYQGFPVTNIVTVLNLGPSTISSVVVSNFVSPLLTNVVVLPEQGVFNPFNGTWNALALPAGGSVSMSIQAALAANATGLFTNSASVSAPNGVTDPVLTNNFASDVDIGLALPNLTVAKAGPTNATAGTDFSYTITVSNTGAGIASNVVAQDVLPSGLKFVSVSGGGSISGGVATWTLGTLASGAATNVALTVTPPWIGGTFTNVATITASTPGLSPTNSTSLPVTTFVAPGPPNAGQLSITGLDDAGVHLVWTGPFGDAFSIQTTTNLAVPAWGTVTNFISTDTVLMFVDPAATNDFSRFYRAKSGN